MKRNVFAIATLAEIHCSEEYETYQSEEECSDWKNMYAETVSGSGIDYPDVAAMIEYMYEKRWLPR